MRKGILSIVGVLLTLLLVACGSSQPQPAPQQSQQAAQTTGSLPQGQPVKTAKGTYFNIDVNQLKPLLEDDSVFTVNVHIPYAGDIPGTDASIPFNPVARTKRRPEGTPHRIGSDFLRLHLSQGGAYDHPADR